MKKQIFLLLASALLFSCTQSGNEPASTEPEEDASFSVSSDHSISSQASPAESSSSADPLERSPLDEPMIGRQYYLNHIGDIYSVWNTYRGDGITIAVIDRGFDADHEEFNGKIHEYSGSFALRNNTDPHAVFTKGKAAARSSAPGEESHGTFCAGVAAAGLNGKGVVGIAPNATLMLLKTDGKPKSIVDAMYHAVEHGAHVISISIGSHWGYPQREDLIDDGSDLAEVFNDATTYCYNANCPVISAGGNGGEGGPTNYTWPGASTNVIGVGGLAANTSEELWTGSSYNSSSAYTFIDCLAPSDMMYNACDYGSKYDGGWDGTSFAAPQVAGLAALYFQKNPNATSAQFEKALKDSCKKLEHSSIVTEDQIGYGRVDAGALIGIACGAKSVNVRAKGNFSKLYCYAFNVAADRSNAPWPGLAMTKGNDGTFTLNVPTGTYDTLVINEGVNQYGQNIGVQSVDLAVTSFQDGHTYYMDTGINECGCVVGRYA